MTDAEFESGLRSLGGGSASCRFQPGERFGDWMVTGFLAAGGSAEVYCAEHVVLKTPAALKVLTEPLTDARKVRFFGEARLLAELKSMAYPRFHAYGDRDGLPYLVEELLEPRDLPVGDKGRAEFLLALCDGLGELHAKGLVHRDLKVANILFRKNGSPVIVDLGLSKSSAVRLAPGTGVSIVDGKAVGVGTPEYAAPEQFIGGDVTPATDIHALGVLAQKLMPADAGGFDAAAWRRIIWRATSSIPSERYQTVAVFARAIRRRHWLKYIVMGVTAAVVMSLLGWWAYAVFGPKFPTELKLAGRSVIRSDFVRLEPGKTYRVIGPGLLDAHITGPDSARLWLTNCTFLNRADKTFPSVGLKYELAGGVFLDFVDAQRPADDGEVGRHVKGLEGNRNSIRFGPPNTLRELMRVLNLEDADDR